MVIVGIYEPGSRFATTPRNLEHIIPYMDAMAYDLPRFIFGRSFILKHMDPSCDP